MYSVLDFVLLRTMYRVHNPDPFSLSTLFQLVLI